MTSTINETMQAALDYASAGWHVFPVQPAPGKKPIVKKGFHVATTDEETIRSWWSQWPNAQIGVACGASKLVAIDLDEKPDENVSGSAQLDLLQFELGMLQCGLEMQTPRNNGRQLFFSDERQLLRRRLGVRPGLDVLGEGGYTIVPSPASPGRSWVYGDPLDPGDLTGLSSSWIDELGIGRPATSSRDNAPDAASSRVVLTDTVVADIEEALAHIPNDERAEWIRVGMALKSTGAGEQAYDLWVQWSKATASGEVHPKFDEDDQRSQWESLVVARKNASEVTLPTLFYMAQEHGYTGTVHGTDAPELLLGAAAEIAAGKPELDLESPMMSQSSITIEDWEDVADMPPIEWMVEALVPEKSIILLGGDTEAGKSFLSIDLAMRMVHGLPFQGFEVRPGNVLYLAGEGQAGMASRFRAWRAHHANATAGDRYCVVSSEIPLLSKKTMGNLHELVKQVATWKGAAPDLIVIDTLSQGLEEDENDASVVSPVIRGLMALRRRWGCSILVVHHLVKLGAKGRGPAPTATRDSIRGSSALTRNTDTVLGLLVDPSGVGGRSLHVWKQKDGEKPEPIQMFLLPVETGRQRADGTEETSCILIPNATAGQASDDDDEEREEPQVDQAALALAAYQRTVDRVVETLFARKAVNGPGSLGGMSGSAVSKAAGMRKGDTLAALEGALAEGRVLNAGTAARPIWVAVPKPDGSAVPNGSADSSPET